MASLYRLRERFLERPNHGGVVALASEGLDLVNRGGGRHGGPVRASARHRLVSGRDAKDARPERDALAAQAARIAAAVEVLMMMEDEGQLVAEAVALLGDPHGEGRVALHE